MQYSIVNHSYLSKLTNEFRIDAECYSPKYLAQQKQIEKFETKSVKDLSVSVINFGAYSLCNYIEFLEEGIPFLVTENINNNLINISNPLFISKEVHDLLYKSHCKNNQVLLTMAGAYLGQAAVFDEGFECSSNQAIAKITLKSDKINSYYLSTFLNCDFGQFQINRFRTGTGQPNLNLGLIQTIQIPLLVISFQNVIEHCVKKAKSLIRLSSECYQQTENLLLEGLGLKDWKPKHQLSYIKNYSDTQKAERFDAEYFQPQYDAIIEKIKNIQNDDLGNIVKWSKGIEVGSEQYIDEGFDFVRISDFSTKGIVKASKKISHDLFAELKDKFSPKRGDILFTKDGTIGLTYLVNQDQDSIISGAFLKLRPKTDIEPEYLALVLNSIICKKQIEMMSGGAIIAHLKPSDAMKLQIPILNPERQKEISLQLIDAKEKDKKSKALLEIAKQAVEMAIESNEDQASKWIACELEKLEIQLSNE